MKRILKKKAQILRKKGRSYSEILKEIKVSKSTLSLWLREVNLTKTQSQRLTIKKRRSAFLGGLAKRRKRIDTVNKIISLSKKEIGAVNLESLKKIGAVLYWCEGAKQKETNVSQCVAFSNSDPKMINLFLLWLKSCLDVKKEKIKLEIYIHETKLKEIDKIKEYWSKKISLPIEKLNKIYIKRSKENTLRKKTGVNYFGLVRIKVKQSTNLNRKIQGWIEGICDQCGVV